VVVIEATSILENGGIVPGASVGASPELIQMADKIIIEVNTAIPDMEGLHDITMTDLPPNRKPYLIMAPEDRIGTTYIPVDTEKIVAIVESDYMDHTNANSHADDTSKAIASHLIEFLEHEVAHDRLPKNLLPIQSGIGNIANAVIGGLAHSNFEHLKCGPRSCKIHSSIFSTLDILTLQLRLLFDFLQMVSSGSTMVGSNTTTSYSCDPRQSRILPRLSDGWVSLA